MSIQHNYVPCRWSVVQGWKTADPRGVFQIFFKWQDCLNCLLSLAREPRTSGRFEDQPFCELAGCLSREITSDLGRGSPADTRLSLVDHRLRYPSEIKSAGWGPSEGDRLRWQTDGSFLCNFNLAHQGGLHRVARHIKWRAGHMIGISGNSCPWGNHTLFCVMQQNSCWDCTDAGLWP